MIGRTFLRIVFNGVSTRVHDAGINSMKASDHAHVEALPLKAKHDVISHQVGAWKRGNALRIGMNSLC